MRRSAAPSQRGRPAFVPPRMASAPLTARQPTATPTLPAVQKAAPPPTAAPRLADPVVPALVSPVAQTPSANGPLATKATPSTATTAILAPKRAKFSAPKVMRPPVEQEDAEKEKPWRYFNVVWCKYSNKKHKKWEGDALLMVRNSTAVLKDMEGKDISKSATMRAKDLETLSEGESLTFSGKEVEIMGKVSAEDWATGKCFKGGTTTSSIGGAASGYNLAKPKRTGFKSVTAAHGTTAAEKREVTPRFDITNPDALVIDHPEGKKHQRIPVVVDPHLSFHLRPHQRVGVKFLWECIVGKPGVEGQGAILADDMGLGKTLQCIATAWTALKQGHDGQPLVNRVMVVCPGSLVKNWEKEFYKWLGRERISIFAVTADKTLEEFSASTLYPVVIISYEMFLRSIKKIGKMRIDLLICDEAHRLKNTNAKTTQAMMGLSVRRRIALTGTPVQNDLQEFFAIVDFVNPAALGSQASFRRVYEEPIVSSRQPEANAATKALGEARAKELYRVMSLFILRRNKDINLRYLPPKSEYVVFCAPSPIQLDLYRALLQSRMVRDCLQGQFGSSRHLVVIGALKSLCNSPTLTRLAHEQALSENNAESIYAGLGSVLPPNLDDAADLSANGKLSFLSQMLEQLRKAPAQERVLVVSNSTKCLDRIEALCRICKYPFLRLQGSTPTAKRLEMVDRFNSRRCDDFVFLMSSKAGGVGLNIVGASRLVLYDTDWNPANDLQAMARVWRDGQKRKVFIYRLLCTGTIEEKIYQRQISKQGLSGAVVDDKKGDSGSSVAFSLEELRDLFTLRTDTISETYDLLGRPGSSTKAAGPPAGGRSAPKQQLSMDELLKWKHFEPPLPVSSVDDDLFNHMAPGAFSCLFMNCTDPALAASSGVEIGPEADADTTARALSQGQSLAAVSSTTGAEDAVAAQGENSDSGGDSDEGDSDEGDDAALETALEVFEGQDDQPMAVVEDEDDELDADVSAL